MREVSTRRLAVIQGIMPRSLRPTSSDGWAACLARSALKPTWPALFSSTQSLANAPLWNARNPVWTAHVPAVSAWEDDSHGALQRYYASVEATSVETMSLKTVVATSVETTSLKTTSL